MQRVTRTGRAGEAHCSPRSSRSLATLFTLPALAALFALPVIAALFALPTLTALFARLILPTLTVLSSLTASTALSNLPAIAALTAFPELPALSTSGWTGGARHLWVGWRCETPLGGLEVRDTSEWAGGARHIWVGWRCEAISISNGPLLAGGGLVRGDRRRPLRPRIPAVARTDRGAHALGAGGKAPKKSRLFYFFFFEFPPGDFL
eukprot:gene23280-biopygen20807